MTRPTFMTINLAALKHNFLRIRQLAPHSKMIAMVKANAYGHGIKRVAQALPDADAFGVASLDEGLMLRDAGIAQAIVLMEGLFEAHELPDAAHYDCTLVVHHEQHLAMLENATLLQPLSVWLKINTGMHRLGFQPAQLQAAYERLLRCTNVRKPIGLMTHFAEADKVAEDSLTTTQIREFQLLTDDLEGPRSLANSAGILGWPIAHADWVRPGLMLYGASPFVVQTGLDHGLMPVMTLSSRIIAIIPVKKGGRVGYGGEWTASSDTQVGVVGIGYGDGYPQGAKNGTPVLVNGHATQLVGRVSMDMLTVDLSNVPNAAIGDTVILWGDGLPVEWVARHNHTSAWELLTRMTPRPHTRIVTSKTDAVSTL